MPDAPPRPRCPVHGLALGADGSCVRCRRQQGPPPIRRRPRGSALTALAGVVVVGSVVGFAAYRAARRARESPQLAPEPGPAIAVRPVAPRAVAPPPPRPVQKLIRISSRRDSRAAPPPAPTAAVPARPDAAPARAPARRAPDPDQLLAIMRRVPMTVYTAPWCAQCRRAMAWVRSNQLSAEERDIEASAEAKASFRAVSSGRTLPTFVIETQVYPGFAEKRIWAALVEAARRRLDAP
jgi:glutaredoxin